jgi:hypothetical protein
MATTLRALNAAGELIACLAICGMGLIGLASTL